MKHWPPPDRRDVELNTLCALIVWALLFGCLSVATAIAGMV